MLKISMNGSKWKYFQYVQLNKDMGFKVMF